MKRIVLLTTFCFFALFKLIAADYYWIGNSGNWNDLSKWSSISGGPGNSYGALPGLNDRIFIDTASFDVNGHTITFNVPSATVAAFIWTAPETATFTSVATNVLTIRGSIVLAPEMTNNFLGVINLSPVSTTIQDSIKTGGNLFRNDVVINGQGTYNLLDNMGLSAGTLKYNRGVWNIANRTITAPKFESATVLSRTITATNSVFNITGSGTVLEISASTAFAATDLNTATINITYAGNDTITLIPGGTSQEWGTFNTNASNILLNRGFAVQTMNIQTVNSLEISPAQTLKANSVNTQASCGKYTKIFSTEGAANVEDFGTTWTLSNVRLKNIHVTAGTYVANNSLDDGGNEGWTINQRPGTTTYYWIGGAGDYYDSLHWSTTSGGTPSNCFPGPSDIAIFDALSGFSAGDVVTLNEHASLNTMNWTALPVAVIFRANEDNVFNIKTSLLGSSNLSFDWDGYFEFNTTSPQIDITSNGGVWNVDFVVSNTNSLRLLDAFQHSRDIELLNGGINTNSNNAIIHNLIALAEEENLNFNFSNSSIDVTGEFFMLEANTITWNASPSKIDFKTTENYAVQFMAAGLAYDTVVVQAKNLDLFSSNSFSHLILTPGTSMMIENNSTQTFDSLVADGDCINRIRIRSFNNALPPAQLVRSTNDTTYTSFLVIDYIDTDTTAGKRYFAANSDTINGSNFWNISDASVGTTYYWVGDGGNWSDVSHWSLSTGGAPALCIPGFKDTVIFDANSFSLANEIVIVDIEAYFKVMDWSASTNTPILQLDRNLIAADDVILESNLTVLSNGSESGLIFQPDGLNAIFNPAECDFGVGIVLSGRQVTDSLTFAGNLLGVDFSAVIVFGGFLYTNDFDLQTGTFTILLNQPKRIDLGSSTISLAQGFSDQSNSTSLTFNAQTSSMEIGGGNANNYLETTNLAFNDVSLNFSNLQFNPLTGNNSFNNLTVNAGSKVNVRAGTTQTITNELIFAGTCNDSIFIQSDTAGVAVNFVKAADSVQAQCLNLTDVNGSGGALFKTYFSTDYGNNTGWVFDAADATQASISSFSQLCFGDTSTFVNSSTSFDGDYNSLTFEWYFGDGAYLAGDTSQHVFGLFGGVDVTLISSYLGCKDTTVESITILNPIVSMSTTVPSQVICSQREVTFSGSTIPANLDMEYFVNGTSQGLLTAGANTFVTTSLANQDTISVIAYQGSCSVEVDNPLVFTVLPIPTMSITSNPASTTICEADAIEFTATSADNYRFHKNGSPLGLYNVANTITLTDIANGDQIYVIGRTDSTMCTNSSDTITFTVNPRPATTLSQSDADQIICAGESVTFTSGGAATYQYRINGVAQTAFIGNTWATTALSNGDVVSVLGRTAAGCEFVAPQTFSYIVNPIPTTTITSSDADFTICQGENVQFSSTGASTYQLFVNGVGLGTPTGTPVFNTTTLNDNDVVFIQGSSSGCNGNSSSLTFTVNPIPTVTLTSSDADNIICFGENVDFEANGATNYEFFVAGTSQGPASTANTFSTTTLLSGQTITVVGESLNCSANASLNFVVNPSPNPSLISSVPSNQVCEGTSVTYTASNATTYEFFVNGVSQGAPSATTSLAIIPPAPGVAVNIVGYNANGCFANSNTINTNVTPLPIVSLASSDGDNIICQGEQIDFTAGGASNYQFFLNGVSQGLASSNNLFSSTSITNGQTVTVRGFNGNCSALSAQSYTITVNPIPSVTLSSSDLDNSFCQGELVSITAAGATNYEFLLNGISQGPSSPVNSIDLSGVAAGTVTITAIGETLGCSSQQNINQLINPLPTVTIASSDASNTFCSGTIAQFTANGASSYDFYVNGTLIETNLTGLFQSTTLNDNDIISVEGSTTASCSAATTPSVVVTVLTTPTVTLNASQLTSACIGDEITFTANGANNYEFFVNGNSVASPSANNTFVTTGITNGQSISVVGESAGCAASGNQTLTYQVFNYPVVTLFDNNAATNLCVGDATNFSSTGADEYLFSINGVAQGVFDANNTYSASFNPGDVITVEGITNGCASEAPQSFAPTVYNYPTPTLASTDLDNEICLGESVTFSGTGAMEYELLIDGISQGIASTDTWITSSLEDGQVVTLNGFNGTCSAPAPEVLTFTVLSMDLSLTSTPTSFMLCEGEDLIIDFTGADEYEVFVNSVSQGGLTTSTTITLNNLAHNDLVEVVGLSNTTGCLQSFENDVYVQVLSSPEITINGPDTFCDGDSVALSSNWLTYNFWYQDGVLIDDSGINQIYASESGDYSLDVSYGGNSEVWSFGNNGYGVFGNGDNFNSASPIKANNLAEVVKISSGGEFSTAIDVNGALWIWGLNSSGQLGLGTFTSTNEPEINANIPQVLDAAAGYDFVVAVDTDGNVFSWGQNEFGQLGLGNTQVFNFPQFVASVNDVIAVSAGRKHTIALKNDGTVWTAGDNEFGQLGNGTLNGSTSFVQVSGLTNIESIEAGEYSSFAISSTNELFVWGNNSQGQLGMGDLNNRTTATLSNIKNVTEVSSGLAHTAVVTASGKLYTFGNNNYGQLGTSDLIQSNSPVLIQDLNGVKTVRAGAHHTLIKRNDNSIWGTGRNNNNQLGDLAGTNVLSFERLENVQGVTEMEAGLNFSHFVYGLNTSCVSQPVAIEVLDNPVATITLVDGMLEANEGVSYQWFIEGNIIVSGTNQTQLPSQSGNYTVLVTYASGCSSLSEPFAYNIASIPGEDELTFINLYPNPTSSGSYIEWSETVIVKSIQVRDISGREVMEIQPEINSVYIDMESYPVGMYNVTLIFENQSQHTIKLVKQH